MKKNIKFESLKWEILNIQTELYLKKAMDAEAAIEKVPEIGSELKTLLITLALNPNNCDISYLRESSFVDVINIQTASQVGVVPTIDLTRKISVTDEDYLKEGYKKSLNKRRNNIPSIDDLKYKETLEEQVFYRRKVGIFDPKKDYLDKEETKAEVVRQLGMYMHVYMLPIVDISSHDWDVFFDVLYGIYEEKKIEYLFDQQMISLLRNALAAVLIKDYRSITIDDFIDSLKHLVVENGHFTEKEITKIQKALKKEMQQCKVLQFPKKSN